MSAYGASSFRGWWSGCSHCSFIVAARAFAAESRRLVGRAAAVGVFYSFASIAMFSSTRHIPVPVFIILFYTYPMIVAMLSRVLGERLPFIFWVLLLITLCGVILTVATNPIAAEGMGADAPLGMMFALLAAFLIASYIVCNQRILRGQGAELRTVAIGVGWMISSGALTLVVVALLSGQGLGVAAASDAWALLVLLGLVVSFAIYTMNMGIQLLGGPQAALVANVEVIFTMIFAWIFLGEWLEPLELLGGVLILGSVVVFAQWQLQQKRPA